MKSYFSILIFSLGSVLGVAQHALAMTVSKVSAGNESVDVSKPHSITFTFAEDPSAVNCGIKINWGDGKTERLRVGQTQQLRPPFTIEHVYESPGSYRVSIDGELLVRGLNTVSACNVKYQSNLLVRPAGQVAAASLSAPIGDTVKGPADPQGGGTTPEPAKAGNLPASPTVGSPQEQARGQGESGSLKTGISYSPTALSHNWVNTWGKRDQFGDNRRTLFSCVAFNASNTPILRGNEMSWRGNDSESITTACQVWADLTKSVLTGNKLTKVKSEAEAENQTFVTATFEGVATLKSMLMNPSRDSYAGWYEVKGDKFFSLGTYASPLSNKPTSGVAKYKGDFTLERSSTLTDTDIAVDFAKNQLSIKTKFTDNGRNNGQAETITPITFNPVTGYFSGELLQSTYRPMLPPPNHITTNKIAISGVVGGDRGSLIAATLYTGIVGRSFDFLVVRRQ